MEGGGSTGEIDQSQLQVGQQLPVPVSSAPRGCRQVWVQPGFRMTPPPKNDGVNHVISTW